MKRLIVIVSCLLPIAAVAQSTPSPIPLSQPLLGHLLDYLQRGGTRAEGDMLAKQVVDEAQAPQKVAAADADKARIAALEKQVADAKTAGPAPPTAKQ